MKHFAKILFLGTALAAPLAHATPISANFGVSGSLTYSYNSSNGLATAQFQAPENFTTDPTDPTNSTVYPYFATGNPLSFLSGVFYLGPTGNQVNFGTAGAQLFTSTEKGETITFYITDSTAQYVGAGGAVITGDGYFTETCSTNPCGTGDVNYTQTSATYSLDPSSVSGSSTFSANTVTNAVAVTPEPSSLMLLGSGLVGAAGMVLRRRRAV